MRALVLAVLLIATPVFAQERAPSRVDYPGFVRLTAEVQQARAGRLLTLEQFWEKAASGEALILDARSADAFAQGHIAGAVNLPFTDFTDESLAAVIGDNPGRPILIYCNNNFSNNARPVVLKRVEVALNIQTFINLVGYGYDNVWELAEQVDFNDPRVRWVQGPAAASVDVGQRR